MKRINILLLWAIILFACAAKQAHNYYSWAALASNQAVNFGDANNAVSTGVFSQKSSFGSSTQCMTKANASTYLNVDESYGPFASKATNQLIVKSDLIAYGYVAILVYTTYNGGTCGGSGSTMTLYFDTTFTNCYTDSALTTPFNGGNHWWYCDNNGTNYRIGSTGAVITIYSC